MSSRKEKWIDHKVEMLMSDTAPDILKILPSDLQLAIKGLIRQGFETGHNWGFQHGLSYGGSAIEPIYYAPEPAVEITQESRDVA